MARKDYAAFLFLSMSITIFQVVESQWTPATVFVKESRIGEDAVKIDIKTVDDFLQLWMVPAENVWSEAATMVKVEIDELGVIKKENSKIEKSSIKIYKNDKHGSVLMLNGNKIEGLIDHKRAIKFDGNNHYVRKITFDKFKDKIVKLPNFLKTKLNNQNVIHKQDNPTAIPREGNPTAIPRQHNPTAIPRQEYDPIAKNVRTSEYTVELHIMVDYDLASRFKAANGNIDTDAIKRYCSIYGNGIQNVYDTITPAPAIKFKLVGLTIYIDQSSEPSFFAASKVANNEYDSDKLLDKFSDWLATSEAPTQKYDSIYLMTSKKIYGGFLGVAFMGGVCERYSHFCGNSGFGFDKGMYDGIYTACHEIAHNLGSDHDGDGYAKSCPWSGGYIMSYEDDGTTNKVKFSSCSISAMQYTLSQASCATTIDATPDSSIPSVSNLPGEEITATKLCQRMFDDAGAIGLNSDNMCLTITCKKSDGSTENYSEAAPPGMPCENADGTTGKCKVGKCVS